ncbi:MAG: energy-coupled thiamine transporter ThiT [Bacillota bacterium]|nr:energy-coupled thiamine transporter ThiT [Bacillota bacterium]
MAEIKRDNIKIITECAVLIALGTILAQVKIYRMPNGGSVTAASMVPFLLVAYRHGTKWGILVGFANSLLQMLIGGIYPPVAPGALGYFAEILLDYLLAYMALGLSYVFFRPFSANKKLLGVGISSLSCCLIRFICAFLSGFLVWADVLVSGKAAIIYSFGYNLSYLGPESLITIAVMCTLYKVYPKIFTRQH